MPIVVFAENCTDGTNEWLEKYKKDLNLEVYIEQNEVQRGIGGGIDFCVSKVLTEPDFFKPMETYIPVKPDWSDLNETIEKVLGNFKDYSYIIENARKKVVEMYSYRNVCMYWYNFFSNLNGVKNA